MHAAVCALSVLRVSLMIKRVVLRSTGVALTPALIGGGGGGGVCVCVCLLVGCSD